MTAMGKRLARLEARTVGNGDLVLAVLIDDLVIGDAPEDVNWNEDLWAVRDFSPAGRQWERREGEAPAAFRHRVSRDLQTYGPAGTLPPICGSGPKVNRHC